MNIKNTTITVTGTVCALLLAGYGAHAQNLFVGSYGSQSLIEISGGTQTTFATGLNYPTGLAFDSSGDLFESDQFSGNIYEWAGAGTTRTTFVSDLNQPNYMAFNTAGDLFVSMDGTAIDEFNTKGSLINTITTGLANATGIAFDSAGNMYVANDNGFGATSGYVLKITTGGTESIYASGLNYPEGMAFNASGDLYVCNGNPSSSIVEIKPGDVQSTFASDLNGPNCIAFNSAGDMFVADAGLYNIGGDITEFDANGNVLGVDTSISNPVSLAFEGLALPVPEPSEYALFGLGAVALVVFSQKKKIAVRG